MPTTRAGRRIKILDVLDADSLGELAKHLSLDEEMTWSITCQACYAACNKEVLDARSRIVKVCYYHLPQKTIHVHMLIPFGIKLFYVDLPAKIVHEVLVLPRTVKRAWQMCDGGRNFILKMCHITYTRFRVGARSGSWAMPVGKQLIPSTTYYNVVDIKFECQAPPEFPGSCTRVTQTLNSCTRNPNKFHQNFPRSMLCIGFNAPFECYEQAVQQIVGDARPPLTGEPVNACLAPSPILVPPAEKPISGSRLVKVGPALIAV